MADIAAGPIKDPTRSSRRGQRWRFLAQIVISVIALVSGVLELQMLQDVTAGIFDGDESFEDVAAANDMRQSIVGVVQALTFITSGVLILMWIYRANFNADRLGAVG